MSKGDSRPTGDGSREGSPPATREVSVPLQPTREIKAAPTVGVTRDVTVPHPAMREPEAQQVQQYQRPPSQQFPSQQSLPPLTSQDPITKLLRAVKEVALEAVTIVRYPRDFTTRLALDDQNLLLHGTRFLLGSIPATFVILLPVHVIHGRPISQTALGFLFAGLAFFNGILLHGALRAVGARKTPITATIGLYSYIAGFQGLLFILLTYPVGLRFGSRIYFGGTPEETQAILQSMSLNDAIFTTISLLLAYLISVVFLLAGFVPLIAKFYQLTKPAWLRAAVAVVISLWITGMLVTYFLPIIRRAADSL